MKHLIPSLNVSNLPQLPIAAQAVTTMQGLKTAMGSAVGLLIMFAYVAALVIFIAGMMKKESDPSGAANAIKTAAWLAGGTTIVTILFAIFGQGDAVVQANFN